MILVGYLVEAAPQVLVWWGGFHFHENGNLTDKTTITYKNSSHLNISKPQPKASAECFFRILSPFE